jgi:hypothetical protein
MVESKIARVVCNMKYSSTLVLVCGKQAKEKIIIEISGLARFVDECQ